MNKEKKTLRKKHDSKTTKIVKPDIESLASYGLKNKEIADLYNLNETTLGIKYKDELIKGRANLRMSLRKKQLQVAYQGNVTMLIWLGKQYLDQVDRINDSGLTETETAKLKEFIQMQMQESL